MCWVADILFSSKKPISSGGNKAWGCPIITISKLFIVMKYTAICTYCTHVYIMQMYRYRNLLKIFTYRQPHEKTSNFFYHVLYKAASECLFSHFSTKLFKIYACFENHTEFHRIKCTLCRISYMCCNIHCHFNTAPLCNCPIKLSPVTMFLNIVTF